MHVECASLQWTLSDNWVIILKKEVKCWPYSYSRIFVQKKIVHGVIVKEKKIFSVILIEQQHRNFFGGHNKNNHHFKFIH